MIVVIAGIKRSGSTAQFNMIRLILEKKYTLHLTGNPLDISEEVTIVKVHPFYPELYDKSNYVFTTDRSDGEINLSLDKFNPKNRKTMQEMREDLEKWKHKSIHMEYNDIVNHPKKCIQQIINVFKIDVDCDLILEEFLKISPPTDGYDPVTFLFHNHISKK